MKNILQENNLINPPKIGEILKGKVIGAGKSSLLIDLGYFGTGIIYGREFYEVKNTLKKLKKGEELSVKITELENEDGYIELSLSQADKEIGWKNLLEKKRQDETIDIKISGVNKGGLLANVLGVPGFLPISQLSPEHYPRVKNADPIKILNELQKFMGMEMKIKILAVNPREEKLILSEKMKEVKKIKEVLKNYKVGDTVEGEISGLANFGAFMKFLLPPKIRTKDIKEIEGFIHLSEMEWQLIENPSEVVKIGEKVKAKIIEISDEKVSLSLKAMKEDPWKDIEKKYKKGSNVKGKAVKLNPYGAFIEISKKIQGLCHISNFGTSANMQKALKIGEKYNFNILQVDSKNHRMLLELVK
ncbi:MAG: S1 RNA-binding domain-containing protein [Patescibacteria group bacterium]|nr:S1 RNA-binding domain-containing protein [Patescibacteria group bacterium]